MMKKLIIAAAGSGKTRTLIHKAFNCKDAVLITTYTDKNKDEIAKRFIKLCGYIPSNITILPWYTFILKHFVKPFQGCFWKHTIKGINLVNASSTQYIKEEDIEHFYFDHDKKIYSDKIAQFGIKCNKHYNNIAINTLAQIYKYIFINDLKDITEGVLKFSIHDPQHHIERYVELIKKSLPKHLKIMTSGNEWMDIQDEKINKGFGINFLIKTLNLTKNDCMAFGDQMNDYELLKNVKYSFAMKNAIPPIKEIA